MVSDPEPSVATGPATTLAQLREDLRRRVVLTVVVALAPAVLTLAFSPAAGVLASLLDAALLGGALWLSRAEPTVPTPAAGDGVSVTMSANQVLLLLLAAGGAAVLVVSGAGSRSLHGLAVAPFAMAAFAMSSRNPRDLRSGVAAAAASLGVLSVADARPQVMVVCGFGLVVLAFGWIAVRELLVLDSATDEQLLTTSGRRPWGVLVVVRLGVLAAVAALLLPSQPPARGHAGGGAGSTAPPGGRGYAIAGADGVLDLRERGSLSADPVLDVPAGTPRLWAGGYLDTYDGSTWSRSMPSTGVAPRYGPLPARSSLPTVAGAQVSEVHRFVATPLVYAPGPLLGVAGDPGGRWYDMGTGSIAVIDRSNLKAPYLAEWAPPGSATTSVMTATHPPVADPRWLQLPDTLPERVPALARTVTASARTTADKVSAVEDYLRSHEKYQLDSPVPGAGNDAVDMFLFRDHVGFCEQFASAETVLLRSLGIPARLVTGFGGSGAVGAGGRRVYRNEDAHAWVQVGLPGERWVDSDPTAGSALAAVHRHFSLAAWFTRLWLTLTGTALARLLTAGGLVAGALLTWAVVQLLQSRPRPRAAVGTEAATEAGRAYQRLLTRLAEQDRPRRPTETVRDLLVRARVHPVELVAQVLETEWYGDGRAPRPDQVAQVVAALDAAAAEPVAALAP